MIEHHPEPPAQWPPDGDRPRQWAACFTGPNDPVILRHYAILGPGEDLTEYPRTLELSIEEWQESHADYGLTVDGTLIEAAP